MAPAQTASTAQPRIAVELTIMARDAIEVSAFTWSRIQRPCEPDPSRIGSAAKRQDCNVPKKYSSSFFTSVSAKVDPAVRA
jgi:hypothetical protein